MSRPFSSSPEILQRLFALRFYHISFASSHHRRRSFDVSIPALAFLMHAYYQ